MYKSLFNLYYRLLAQPAPAWESLSEDADRDNESFYKNFLFPSLGIVCLATFLGTLFPKSDAPFQLALKEVIRQIIVCGGSYYLSAYVLSEWVFPKVEHPKNRFLAARFIGYSFTTTYLIYVIEALIPDFFLIWAVKLCVLYTLYIVWMGASHYLKLEEKHWTTFTVAVGLLILVTPWLLGWILGIFMN